MTESLDKMTEALKLLKKITKRIRDVKFKIVIVKGSYFFFVDEKYIDTYYKKEHQHIKGWYTGILSLKRNDSDLHVFVSEILYRREDSTLILLRILYQILIYLNLDFFKLKYKKFRKRLKAFLEENLPSVVRFDPTYLDKLLNTNFSEKQYEDAEFIIPHMTLHDLIIRLPPSEEEIQYLDKVESYLNPHEYMPLHSEDHVHGTGHDTHR